MRTFSCTVLVIDALGTMSHCISCCMYCKEFCPYQNFPNLYNWFLFNHSRALGSYSEINVYVASLRKNLQRVNDIKIHPVYTSKTPIFIIFVCNCVFGMVFIHKTNLHYSNVKYAKQRQAEDNHGINKNEKNKKTE